MIVFFCHNVHGALAAHYMQCSMAFIDAVKNDFGLPLFLKN
jgi:hypothetical protein